MDTIAPEHLLTHHNPFGQNYLSASEKYVSSMLYVTYFKTFKTAVLNPPVPGPTGKPQTII